MSITTARIPATLLYWGSIPAGASVAEIGYRFEQVLPLAIEHLHTARALFPDGSGIVVGLEPERLRAFLATASITPETWSLVPDQSPDHLHEVMQRAPNMLDRLNLLHGEFEPAPRRRLRQVLSGIIGAGLVLATVLCLIGIERRRAAALRATNVLTQSATALIDRSLPTIVGSTMPAALRLTTEVRRLEQAAKFAAPNDSVDTPRVLEALFKRLPADLRVHAETVTVTSDRIVVRGQVPTLADAERIREMGNDFSVDDQHYRAEPMQASQQAASAGFVLTLVRQASP